MYKQKTKIDENIEIFNYDNMKIWKYINMGICKQSM